MTDVNIIKEAKGEETGGEAVVPDDPDAKAPAHSADAGTDESIAERLEKDPENKQARLDRGLDELMDASDPPASTQPVHSHEPPPSSGFDEEAERKLREEKARD